MILKNRLLIGIVGFTLLQAAPTAPTGCSCQRKDVIEKQNVETNEKGIIQPKDVMVVRTGSRMSGSVIEVYAKNISDKILNGTLIIKVNYNDGSSHHEERPLRDFYPEEVIEVGFPIYLDRGGFSSYSFVNK